MRRLTIALTATLFSLGGIEGLGAQQFGGSGSADRYELASLPQALRQGTNGQPQSPRSNASDTTSRDGRSLVGRSASGAKLQVGPQRGFGEVNYPNNRQFSASRSQGAASMLTAMLVGLLGFNAH